MVPVNRVLLLLILGGSSAWGQRNKKPLNPIDDIKNVANFDITKFSGKWYLLSVASECNYLKTENHRVEATVIKVSADQNRRKEYLAMNTFREKDGICWEIKNAYYPNEKKKVKGRYILKGKGYMRDVDMVVGDTDYQSHAILYYQQMKKISLKLYGRKTELPNEIYRKFDDLVTKQGMTLEDIYAFPTYGFCDTADRFHILNEVPR